jgi:hypothetical protein
MVEQLMDPALRRQLGGIEIEQMTAAIAAGIRNIYLVVALFAVAALTVATRFPGRLSARGPQNG